MTTEQMATDPTPIVPTQEELMDGLDYGPAEPDDNETTIFAVSSKIVGRTRWGNRTETVFCRRSDQTFWRATYEVTSGDEGRHGLAEGEATVHQVYPHQVTITEYRTKKTQETTP